jgi:uncharacterized metal-binding protein YceD (DUF177 family)
MSKVSKREYVVPVKGLSAGKHEFDFTVDSEFFEAFENTDISGASVEIHLTMDKQPGHISIEGSISGSVVTTCDRCLADMEVVIKAPLSLLVKYTKVKGEPENEEVVTLDPADPDLDLRQFFYDYICLSMPVQRVHDEGDCDPAMIDKLKQMQMKGEMQEKESPFEQLKKLMN